MTTPSPSVEGIREELASIHGLPDSSLTQHQLMTSLTADSVETRLREIKGRDSPPGRAESATNECAVASENVGADGKKSTKLSVGLDEDGGESGTDHDERNRLDGRSGDDGDVAHLSSTEGQVKRIGGEVEEKATQQESGGSSVLQERPGCATSTSQSSTPLDRHRQHRPSPIATPTAPPLSRTSSNDSPTSPFFIPSNPFLSVVGRMPRFQWASVHIQLLDNLLKSLLKIVDKWTAGRYGWDMYSQYFDQHRVMYAYTSSTTASAVSMYI